GVGLADTEADEGQGGFRQHAGGEIQGGVDDNHRDDVGQDVAEDDAELLDAQSLGRGNELLLALGQHAAAHQAGDAGPGEEAQDEHNQDDTLQLGNTVAQNTGQDNTEGKEGDGGDNLGQAHQQVVQLAALVARDAAHNHTDEGGDDNSDSAHGHGHAAAHNQTAEHVAAKAVGAHQVAIQAPALHLAILCDGVAAVVARGHGSHGAVKVGDL